MNCNVRKGSVIRASGRSYLVPKLKMRSMLSIELSKVHNLDEMLHQVSIVPFTVTDEPCLTHRAEFAMIC
jgi:hypothetical protein